MVSLPLQSNFVVSFIEASILLGTVPERSDRFFTETALGRFGFLPSPLFYGIFVGSGLSSPFF